MIRAGLSFSNINEEHSISEKDLISTCILTLLIKHRKNFLREYALLDIARYTINIILHLAGFTKCDSSN